MFFHAVLPTHAACPQGQSDGVPKRKNKKWCQELFWHAKKEDVMFALQNRRRANERGNSSDSDAVTGDILLAS